MVTTAGLDTLRNATEYVPEAASLELSALGETFDSTPMVLPIRANLYRVKRLLNGDLYMGRGSRQRSLPKSRQVTF